MSSPINPVLVARALASAPSTASALPAPSSSFETDNQLLQVFSSGEYSDLVIKCQGQKWKAHRAVVCSQSKPLAAAINGNFSESVTGEINLEEDQPEIIGFMLEYLYKGNITLDVKEGSIKDSVDLESTPQGSPRSISFSYSTLVNSVQGTNVGSSGSGSGYGLPPNSFRPFGNISGSLLYNAGSLPFTPPVNPEHLVTLAEIYIIAEKYDVQPLKTLVKAKYESTLSNGWNTEYFVDSLKLIYDGTPDTSEPDPLRELAITTAATHAKELMDRGEFLDLCKERGDLIIDVFKASLVQTSALESGVRSWIGAGKPSEQQYSYSRRASIPFP